MDVSVPISGVKPGCGPTIHFSSAAAVATGSAIRLESPRARPPFRKLRRLEIHSTGNIWFSSVGDAICWTDDTAAKANWRVDMVRPRGFHLYVYRVWT